MLTRVLLGIFLFVHGLIHLGWATPRPADPAYPFVTTSSRLLPFLPAPMLSPLGRALAVLTALAFTVAALGVIGVPGLSGIWGVAAIVGSVLSLVACAVFWHPWLVAGPLLDIAIIVAVTQGWPRLG